MDRLDKMDNSERQQNNIHNIRLRSQQRPQASGTPPLSPRLIGAISSDTRIPMPSPIEVIMDSPLSVALETPHLSPRLIGAISSDTRIPMPSPTEVIIDGPLPVAQVDHNPAIPRRPLRLLRGIRGLGRATFSRIRNMRTRNVNQDANRPNQDANRPNQDASSPNPGEGQVTFDAERTRNSHTPIRGDENLVGIPDFPTELRTDEEDRARVTLPQRPSGLNIENLVGIPDFPTELRTDEEDRARVTLPQRPSGLNIENLVGIPDFPTEQQQGTQPQDQAHIVAEEEHVLQVVPQDHITILVGEVPQDHIVAWADEVPQDQILVEADVAQQPAQIQRFNPRQFRQDTQES